MNLKLIKLNENDIKLLKFLARFKLMNSNDAIYFYGSSYYQKRLQELKKANYITRYYRTYIKLNPASIRYLESRNIRCEIPCRNKKYIERLSFISKLGIELEKRRIQYKLSWEMKGNNYTDWSRRFIGELTLRNEKYLMYYAKNDSRYIRQLQFDINKDLSYQNVMIFVDDLNVIDNKNQFIFSNKMSCVLIHKKRINSIGKFNNLDIKKIIENELGRIVTFSSINIADYKYMNTNIIYMPYIDTHRIAAINNFYVLGLTEEPVEIWTYEENFEKIKSLLNKESKYLCSFRKIEEIR